MKLLEITVSGFYGFEQTTTVKYVDNRVICVGGLLSFSLCAPIMIRILFSEWIRQIKPPTVIGIFSDSRNGS
jgi:hypothetical protein